MNEVPDDFPGSAPHGAVPGVQVKVLVYRDGDGYTDAAAARRSERYDVCQDLLSQLIAYTQRKSSERAGTPLPTLVEQVLARVQEKRFGWGLSPAEAQWLARRLSVHFGPADTAD